MYWQEIPEETLRDVMLEIQEERERQRVVSVEELKPWLESWIKALEPSITKYDSHERDAYRIVLRLIDDLQGR